MKKVIYLAGGCFWGLEHYMKQWKGILKTEVGYVNGNIKNPTYQDVCYNSQHAEAVKIWYDTNQLSLEDILEKYYAVINPLSYQKQGNDEGIQYRLGIYYEDIEDIEIIQESLNNLQLRYTKPIMIEVKPIDNYAKAEEEHQNYLEKHPNGYCHIPKNFFHKENMTSLQYHITQEKGTEPPFQNEYWNHFEKGIYVDITTGIPLFSSQDKFSSSCGWPSFSKPIDTNHIYKKKDFSHGMIRTEVISKSGNHLGYVFLDGPIQQGGKRYCINSASLKFIPQQDMIKNGYQEYLSKL